MVTLNTSLQSIGISQAKGVDLFMQRDQVEGTMPRSQGAAEQRYNRQELTPEQKRQIEELKRIDRTVREHEAAHLRAGRGVVTSGANFSYTYGPDGKQYAVAGEVGIDTSPERKPEANIDKGNRIQAAALAPKDPSAQDYRVASIGGQLEADGRSELAVQRREEAAAAAERQAERRQATETPDTASDEAMTQAVPQAENRPAIGAEAGRDRVAQAYAPAGGRSEATVNVFA